MNKRLHVTGCRFHSLMDLCYVIARRLKTDEAISLHLRTEIATLPLGSRPEG